MLSKYLLRGRVQGKLLPRSASACWLKLQAMVVFTIEPSQRVFGCRVHISFTHTPSQRRLCHLLAAGSLVVFLRY